jgi:Ca2+/Na+ antiporter
MLAATILFVLVVVFEPIQKITRPDAWILIMFFSIFLYYIFRQAIKPKKNIL